MASLYLHLMRGAGQCGVVFECLALAETTVGQDANKGGEKQRLSDWPDLGSSLAYFMRNRVRLPQEWGKRQLPRIPNERIRRCGRRRRREQPLNVAGNAIGCLDERGVHGLNVAACDRSSPMSDQRCYRC